MKTLFADAEIIIRFSDLLDMSVVSGIRALQELAPETGAAVHPVADGYAVYAVATGLESAVGSRVTGLGMHGPVTPAHFEEAEAFFAARNAPCAVSVFPTAHPSVIQIAAMRGYALVAFRNVLARYISPEDAEGEDDAGPVVVSRLAPEDEPLWSRVARSSFEGQERDEGSLFFAAMYRCPDTAYYLARLEGEPAGCGAMTIRDGMAYIWAVGTRPSMRRRGVQLAVYRTLVREAARAGCDAASLGTEVGHVSQRNAERAGFRLICTGAGIVRPLRTQESK